MQYMASYADQIQEANLTLENPTVLIAFDESEAGTGGRF